MVQVVMNLLINAADAMVNLEGRTPRIRLVTLCDNEWLTAKVIDNGSGIPKQVLPRVFEERFTTKGAGRGSGLGLSVCRSLIAKAGGAIDVRSEEGVGTEVEIRLPVPLLGADCR
jgi:signal transduction histidine kinase